MKDEKEKAVISAITETTATKNTQKAGYTNTPAKSTETRIAERLKSMPKLYRASYKRAMAGRSRKDALNSFCLECVCWERAEVKLCTSPTCPLFPYRPYQDLPPLAENRPLTELPQQNGDGLNNYTQKPVKNNQDDKTAIKGALSDE